NTAHKISKYPLLKFWIYLCILVFCLHVCMCAMSVPGALGDQTEPSIGSPGTRIIDKFSATLWVLGTQIGSSAKAVRGLDPQTISLASRFNILKIPILCFGFL
ncbi:hypothetical protein ACQP3F_27085, partial [Escherichia coli]